MQLSGEKTRARARDGPAIPSRNRAWSPAKSTLVGSFSSSSLDPVGNREVAFGPPRYPSPGPGRAATRARLCNLSYAPTSRYAAHRTYFDTFMVRRSLRGLPGLPRRATMPACLFGHAGEGGVFLTPSRGCPLHDSSAKGMERCKEARRKTRRPPRHPEAYCLIVGGEAGRTDVLTLDLEDRKVALAVFGFEEEVRTFSRRGYQRPSEVNLDAYA